MFICDCQRRAFRVYDLYGTLCCKHCAIRRGAVYASQQQSAKGRAALQAMRLRHFLGGWVGRSPSKPLFMQKRTYRRLITQLRELEAKGRNCQPIKAGHRVIKPVTCIEHRSPRSPTPNAGRPGAPNNATPEAEKSPACKGVRWRIHNRRSTAHSQTRNTVRSSSDNRSHCIHSSMVRSRLESCSRCSTTQRRNLRRLRKLHRDMRGDIPFVERLQRSTLFAVVLYGHQRCPTITRQCSVTGEARLALLSITRHPR